ncbi:14338_t:CDS:2 [Entrophospora sp. SA101]|nr:14338_t:CDS:2 [Entrophospora sp. SA101]
MIDNNKGYWSKANDTTADLEILQLFSEINSESEKLVELKSELNKNQELDSQVKTFWSCFDDSINNNIRGMKIWERGHQCVDEVIGSSLAPRELFNVDALAEYFVPEDTPVLETVPEVEELVMPEQFQNQSNLHQRENILGKGRVEHRRALHGNIQGIRKPSLRKLAHRGGVECISNEFLEDIVGSAVTYMEQARHKTVTCMDVTYALKRKGKLHYGFGV